MGVYSWYVTNPEVLTPQSASVLHMFPEAVEGFASFGEEYERQAFVYFLVGIFIPFFVERILVTHSHSHSASFFKDDNEAPARSSVGVYLLMLMLSIHSLIEGMFHFATINDQVLRLAYKTT